MVNTTKLAALAFIDRKILYFGAFTLGVILVPNQFNIINQPKLFAGMSFTFLTSQMYLWFSSIFNNREFKCVHPDLGAELFAQGGGAIVS